MTRKRPSRGLQWAKKGQKCDVSRKICPSLFFAAARTARKAPGVLKRFLIPPPPRPYTALAACGRCSWCGWQAKARLGVPRRKQRGKTSLHPWFFGPCLLSPRLGPQGRAFLSMSSTNFRPSLFLAGARTAWGLCARRVRCPAAPLSFGLPYRRQSLFFG